jgi:hypothetical protein
MPRRMREPAYPADQWARRYESDVAPINRLVDELGTHTDAGAPPYVAPMYRGVDAPAVAILRDPGPKAGGARGSGFLSVENDDQTAERQCAFLAEAGIDPADVVPWNVYPWYINATPTRTQLVAGVEPLRRLIELMPDLRVVLLAPPRVRQVGRRPWLRRSVGGLCLTVRGSRRRLGSGFRSRATAMRCGTLTF